MSQETLVVIPGQGSYKPENPQAGVPSEIQLLDTTLDRFSRFKDRFPNFQVKKVLGNSYGLYGALVVVGAITAVTAYKLAKERADLVREAEGNSKYPTGMASLIGVTEQGVQDLIVPFNNDIQQKNEKLSDKEEKIPLIVRTNNNGPLAQVIGGPKDYLQQFLEQPRIKGGMLDIEGAYHHPVRQAQQSRYREIVRDFIFKHPNIPLISSTNPRVLQGIEDIIEELVGQITRHVDLPKAAELWQGVHVIIDNGPGEAMQKLLSRIDRKTPILSTESNHDELTVLHDKLPDSE